MGTRKKELSLDWRIYHGLSFNLPTWGSRNKNMTNLALELYTENASKLIFSFRIHACEGNQNYIFELNFFIILANLINAFLRIMFSKQRRLFSIKEILMFLTLLAK